MDQVPVVVAPSPVEEGPLVGSVALVREGLEGRGTVGSEASVKEGRLAGPRLGRGGRRRRRTRARRRPCRSRRWCPRRGRRRGEWAVGVGPRDARLLAAAPHAGGRVVLVVRQEQKPPTSATTASAAEQPEQVDLVRGFALTSDLAWQVGDPAGRPPGPGSGPPATPAPTPTAPRKGRVGVERRVFREEVVALARRVQGSAPGRVKVQDLPPIAKGLAITIVRQR